MAFVCLSHFANACFPEGDPHGRWLRLIGIPATQTFAVLSGVIIGYRMGGPGRERPQEPAMAGHTSVPAAVAKPSWNGASSHESPTCAARTCS
jgi:hypothetical protein